MVRADKIIEAAWNLRTMVREGIDGTKHVSEFREDSQSLTVDGM